MTTPAIQGALLSPAEKQVLEWMLANGGVASAGTPNALISQSVQEGAHGVHQTVITLRDALMTVRDTQQGNGIKLYTFPLGKIFRLGASAENIIITTQSALTTLNSAVAGQFGVGSTTQANATLATTEQDIVQVTAFTSSAVAGTPPAAVRAYGIPNVTLLDGSATAIDAFFNIAIAGATDIDADATVSISGVITLNWLKV